MKFNFRSSGYKIDNKKFKLTPQQKESKKIPIGIKTPLHFGSKNVKLFEMHYNPASQIKDNLKNLLQTNVGERLGRHSFGCNLSALLFERISLDKEFESIVTKQIIDQVEKYIPIIQIDNISFNSNQKELNDTTSLSKIHIKVDYSIPRIQLTNQAIETIMYAGG
jgi:phage baseplate assembly protein W